jgi:hypothetical protein
MDIKLLPNITLIPVNDKTTNNIVMKKNLRIKGKIVNIRKSRTNEEGKYIITIISNSNENISNELNNSEVIINTI